MKNTFTAVALTACLILTGVTHAALHDRGGGLLYDDVLDVTWLQDANYAKTSGRSPDGQLRWQDAQKWVGELVYHDPVRKVDVKGWRLPTVKPIGTEFVYQWHYDGTTDEGYNITSTRSELSYMYYVNLGIRGWWTKDGKHPSEGFGVMGKITAIWTGQADVGLVKNLQSNGYWADCGEATHPWVFTTAEGNQRDGFPYPNNRFVWPVHDGDVTGAAKAQVAPLDEKTRQASIDTVVKTPGLVGFWTFGEEPGQVRTSTGTKDTLPLREVGHAVARVEGGPFSGYAAHFDGNCYFRVLAAELGALNISGKDAKVSMFAVVKLDELKGGRTIAGIWSEGKGANDDSGTRQYSMLINMPLYGGAFQLTPHISGEGGVSRRADGSGLPWCADYAAPRSKLPIGQWVTLGFTYDGKYIRAYHNGVMEEREMDPVKDNRGDSYFTKEGPNGGYRGMNPYYYTKGIFRYDPKIHSATKPSGQTDFTVAARNAGGNMLGEALKGKIAGLAVFDRTLTDAEMKRLHDAANLPALK